MLLKKAHEILAIIVTPIADLLPDMFLGFDGSRTVALMLMIVICFLSGLIFRSSYIKRHIDKVEDNFLSHVPGYTLIKSVTADALGHQTEYSLITVLVTEGEKSKIGFLTEEQGDQCVVFFPEPLKSDSGEVVILPTSAVKKLNVPSNKITLGMKRFGKGLIQYVD